MCCKNLNYVKVIKLIDGESIEQELSYRQQIARQLRTRYAEGIYI